jgi:hypothetical protein
MTRVRSPRALEILDDVKPYDLARPSPTGMAAMYPSYLRGQAYARLGNPTDAEREFMNVANNRGLTLNSALGVLADPDSIRFRTARAEYARLR